MYIYLTAAIYLLIIKTGNLDVTTALDINGKASNIFRRDDNTCANAWVCIDIWKCPAFLRLSQVRIGMGRQPAVVQRFIRKRMCGLVDRSTPKVCCSSTLMSSAKSTTTYTEIVEATAVSDMEVNFAVPHQELTGEFPWMSLIDQASVKHCAKDRAFCEEIENYPYTEISRIMKNSVFAMTGYFEKEKQPQDITSNRYFSQSRICNAVQITVYPKLARNIRDQWKLIINSDSYNQGIEVEICDNEGSKCKLATNNIGIRTKCIQIYTKRRLLSIRSSYETEFDEFLLPAGCVCTYVRDTPSSFFLNRPK